MSFVNLDKAVEFLEATRRKAVFNIALVYTFALLTAVLTLLFFGNHVIITIIIFFVVYCITQEVIISRIHMPYRESFQQEVVYPLLNSISKNLQCSPDKEINTGEFLLSNFFSKLPRFLYCRNLLSGDIDGFETACAEVNARQEVRSKNLNRHIYDEPVTSSFFTGIFIIVKRQKIEHESKSDQCQLVLIPQSVKDVNQNDSLEITINSQHITLQSGNGQSTKKMFIPNSICSDGKSKISEGTHTIGLKSNEEFNTIDEFFDDIFASYVKTEFGKNTIKQIPFREKLVQFKKTWEGQVYFSFSESRCYLALTRLTPSLVPKITKPLNCSTVEILLKDYNSRLRAVELAVALTKLTNIRNLEGKQHNGVYAES